MINVSEEVVIKISNFCKALSDPSRLKIIMSLLNEKGLCVSCIVEKVGMTQTAVSNQLKSLRDVNLVKSERKGKNIIYKLNDDHVRDILNLTMTHMEEDYED